MQTINALAQSVQGCFEIRTRSTDGSEFTCLGDSRPEWLAQALRLAHRGMVPDDYIFNWCREAVVCFAESTDPETVCEEVEAAPYTFELFAWVQSRAERLAMAEETLETAIANGWDGCATITQAISEAMREEKSGTYWAVLHAMTEQIEGVAA